MANEKKSHSKLGPSLTPASRTAEGGGQACAAPLPPLSFVLLSCHPRPVLSLPCLKFWLPPFPPLTLSPILFLFLFPSSPLCLFPLSVLPVLSALGFSVLFLSSFCFLPGSSPSSSLGRQVSCSNSPLPSCVTLS